MNNAIAKLSHMHRAIMDFMIANPEQPNSVVAKQFNVTEAWLSTLIHSELFQMELRYKQDVVFSEVALSVKDRLTNLAHTSLKRLQERLDLNVVSNETLVDVSELALKSLGFGPKPQTPMVAQPPVFQQQNNFHFGSQPADAKMLEEARKRMHAPTRAALPQLTEDIDNVQRIGHSDDDNGTEAGERQEITIEGSAGAREREPLARSVA